MCLCGSMCQRASPAEKHNKQWLPTGLEDHVKADHQQKVMTPRPASQRGIPDCSQSQVLLFLCLDPICGFFFPCKFWNFAGHLDWNLSMRIPNHWVKTCPTKRYYCSAQGYSNIVVTDTLLSQFIPGTSDKHVGCLET